MSMQNSSDRSGSIVSRALFAIAVLATAATAADDSHHRLTYVFDATVAEHAARFERLQDVARPFQHHLEFVGVNRELLPPSSLRLASGVDVELGKVRAWLDESPARDVDLLLLEDGSGHLVITSAADREGMAILSRTLSAIFGTATATEVDFSTWGKVKELFK